jgi:hypothetical protein
MPLSVPKFLTDTARWLGTQEDKIETGVKERIASGKQTVKDIEDWGKDVFEEARNKWGTAPKLPPPIYTFTNAADQAENFRDVGVSSARAVNADGRHFKPDVLTRMQAPAEADRAKYAGRAEVDLRWAPEIAIAGQAPSWRGTPGFEYHHWGIEPQGAYNPLGDDRDMAIAQTMLLLQQGKKVVVHCTHGTDRTGMTVAMTMMAAGFSQQDALGEYLVSAQSKSNDGKSDNGKQIAPDIFNRAVADTFATRKPAGAASGNIDTYVAYLNDLLAKNGVSDRIDRAKLTAAITQ